MVYSYNPRRRYYPRSINPYNRPSSSTTGIYRRPVRGGGRRVGRVGLKNKILSLAEGKFYDQYIPTGSSPYAISDQGTIIKLTDMARGTGDTDRIGDKVVVNSVQINFIFSMFSELSASFSQGVCRLIIFMWKDDTTPTVADILQLGTTIVPPIAALNVHSVLDHDRKVKRKILYDQTFSGSNLMYAVTSTAYQSGAFIVTRNEYIDLKKNAVKTRTISFQGDTQVGVNNIYLLAISNIPVAQGTKRPNFSFYSRVNYVDM